MTKVYKDHADFISTNKTSVIVEEVAVVEEKPATESEPVATQPLTAADIENTTETHTGGITGVETEQEKPQKMTAKIASWFKKTFF